MRALCIHHFPIQIQYSVCVLYIAGCFAIILFSVFAGVPFGICKINPISRTHTKEPHKSEMRRKKEEKNQNECELRIEKYCIIKYTKIYLIKPKIWRQPDISTKHRRVHNVLQH